MNINILDHNFLPANEVLLVQTIIPDYRARLFYGLMQHSGMRIVTAAGAVGFATSLKSVPEYSKCGLALNNKFFFGRRLLWQGGLFQRALRAEVVIAEFCVRSVSTWLIVALRHMLGKPTVLWGHASWRIRGGLPRHILMACCDGFVAYTKTQRRFIQSQFRQVPVWAAPNALMWRSECNSESSGTEVRSSQKNVIYVGRLVPEKKPLLLAVAFIKAVQDGKVPSETKLIFVGEGAERAKIADLARAAGLVERISSLGHISEIESLRQLYAQSLISVSPGYVGLSATQSFSFGVPMLIADDEPHSPEIEACQAGENCLFFRANDSDELSELLGTIFSASGVWLGRRRAISKKALDEYSMDNMVRIFESVVYNMYNLMKANGCRESV